MATCSTCGTRILFGGKKAGDLRFCNDTCASRGALVQAASGVTDDQVKAAAHEVHRGLCPQCGGSGPVDVHVAHQVWSLVVVTSWKSTPCVCCRRCGARKQAGALLFSTLCGWWGFPWGFVMTPIQIVRDLKGLLSPPNPMQPSPALEGQVRLHLASQALGQGAGDAVVAAQPPRPIG